MIFIYNAKELKLSSKKQYNYANRPQLGRVVLSSTLPVVSMTFKVPGGPSPATNIPVVHTLLVAIQLTFI